MSDAPVQSPEVWEPLSMMQRRVIGVLVEKQKTSKSPDAYPMTLNALTTGCNQKSNRDPVLELDEVDVEETLTELQRKGLVSKLVGGRVDRWRHLLYETWHVTKHELAILAELLLRGPQSEGDLRGRASRMDDIKDLDELRAMLRPLTERRLVVYLTPPERRGTILTHGFHTPQELDAARKSSQGMISSAGEAPSPRSTADAASPSLLHKVEALIETMQQEIAALKANQERMQQELAQFRKELGLSEGA